MTNALPAPDRIPWRSLALVVLGGLAGLLLVALLAPRITPRAAVDFRLGREEVLARSAAYLAELGYDVQGLQQDATFAYDTGLSIDLQRRLGMEGANRFMRADSLPIHNWNVSWYDRTVSFRQSKDRYAVMVSPGGSMLGFDHAIADSISMPWISMDSARTLVEAFIAKHYPQASGYPLKTSSAVQQLHRTDYHFTFAKDDHGLELSVVARVQGSEVGGVSWNAQPDPSFVTRFSEVATLETLVASVSMAATFLLFFFVVILFLRKYHEGEVGTNTAVMVFLGFLAVTVLAAVNQFTGSGATWQIGDLNKFNVRIVVFMLNILVVQVFMAVLVFAAWSVGESSSRTTWPAKLIAMDSALFRKFFTTDIAVSVFRGYGWGGILLGVHALVLLGVLQNGRALFLTSLDGVPESFVPGAQPVVLGIASAVFGEIISRLFFFSYLREKTHRMWLGWVIATAVWTLTGYSSWVVPFGTPQLAGHVLILVLYGAAFAALFLRYDLLTAIGAHVIVIAVAIGIPLFTSSADSFAIGRWVFVGLLAVPVLVAAAGLLRRERFVFATETMPAHIQRISERVRMSKELEIARNVQMSLLPKEQPQLSGFDIAGTCIPAQEVGGDYFDFVRLGPGKLGIALGDVSGKGVPAAIYMTLTKGILQSHAGENITPRMVLSKVNSLMYRTIERNSFVSMLYAVLDLEQRTLTFSRAGQCPVVLVADAGGEGSFLTPKGMALGLEGGEVFDSVLQEHEIKLRRGEVAVFYTDGFTEAMNPRQEEFGEQRLVESISRHRHLPAQEMIERICNDIKVFASGAPQHDDMTMVVVRSLDGIVASTGLA